MSVSMYAYIYMYSCTVHKNAINKNEILVNLWTQNEKKNNRYVYDYYECELSFSRLIPKDTNAD